MSEPDSPTRGDLHHQHQHQSSTQNNTEERDDANSSIIGKVRSRVSSIFPQQLTKWFSPSTATGNSPTTNGGVSRRRRRNDEFNNENQEQENSDDDDSNNSAEDEEYASPATSQPPTKRSRLNIEATNTSNLKDKQMFISTPTTGARRRLTHTNLYGQQKEPAYNFTQTKSTIYTQKNIITTNNNSIVDSADIIEVVPDRSLLNSSISSRRSLNIPSTSSNEGYRNLHDLKRRPAIGMRPSSAVGISSYIPKPISNIIQEANDDEDEQETEEVANEDVDVDEDDEESEEIAKVTSKKPKFTNGNRIGRSSSIATESGESRSSSVAQVNSQRSGIFNQSNRGLRTLSGNGLNFYSHLEGQKSLFSEKNMPGMLNNSTLSLTSLNRRQFNSSIYGSTSALSDSRLLNTSSPFYKGQTTYGGAAAYSKFNRALNQSARIAPTLIRPTSSLSTLSSSSNSLAQGNDQANSTISSTAKRILELINDFSTPLNDAKKMASNIKTPTMLASRNASGKRFSENDLNTSRSVRLSSVRKPYTRPTVTLNPSNNESKKLLPPLKELQVPSMSQLLQMKKMQNCTERSRQIANTSKSALNRECEYKLPCENEDVDKKHVSKIKNKVTASSRVSSKNNNAEEEDAPTPANLPNIAFPFMKSVPKIDISVKNSVPAAAPEKSGFKFAGSPDAKPTNNFTFNIAAKQAEVAKPSSPAVSKPSINFNFGERSPPPATSSEFKFSSPLNLNHTPIKRDLAPINNFKFSSPVVVGGQKEVEKVPTSSTVPQLKTGSVLDALKKPTEKVSPAIVKQSTTESAGTSLFGAQFKKSSNEWECSACMVRNKEADQNCVACTTARPKTTSTISSTPPTMPLTNSLVKNTFGDAFKPKSDTWECSMCMVRNKSETNKCVACETSKPGAAVAPSADFKSLAAKQTASKWECDACMTRNDAERNKCVCCEQAKPGTDVVSDNVPKFSFGTNSSAKFTFGFGAAGAKKEEELKAETVTKTENKTGFTFGIPAAKNNDAPEATSSVSSTGFSFGIKPATSATIGKDVPDVVKSNTTGFKFGIQPADSSKSDGTTSTGFSFGIKTDTTKPSTSVKFNLPTTTAESKLPTATSSSAITSTSSSSPAASSTPFSNSGNLFGSSAPIMAPVSAATTVAPTNAVKPFSFGNSSVSEASKTTPNMSFGVSSSTSSTSSVSTPTPSSNFVFGKPAATPTPTTATGTNTAFNKSPSIATGLVFGKDSSSSATPLFGSPATSNVSAVSKTVTPIFGTAAAISTAPATVSSSTTGFVFGKPATTSLFGARTSNTSSPSLFGGPVTSALPAPSTTAPSAPITTASSTPFVFGSGATSNTSQSNKLIFGAISGQSNAPTTTASSWSTTNTFTFGSTKPPEEAKPAAPTPAPSFGSPASFFGQSTPIFGSPQVGEVKPSPVTPAAVPAFGAQPASTSLFGSNTAAAPAAGAVQQTSSNVFGSTSSMPVFGSMGFDTPSFGTPSATAATPAPSAISSNPAPVATFGSNLGSSSFSSGFGALAAASSGSNDGASAPKKADMAFNFGSTQNTGNTGFSFGAAANKPASEAVFKFSTSSAPSFNFTGSSESSNLAQPFQFGAPTSTPAVFNFGGVEGSNSGGPFQFNAAAPAVATNNIFAPLPTPGLGSSQQARRKMRTAVARRTQPR